MKPTPSPMAKLQALHAEHLQNPPGPKEAARSEELYLQALREKTEREREVKALVKKQRALAAKKRATLERHREARARMKAELEELEGSVSETHTALRSSSAVVKSAEDVVSEAAARLVLCHGNAPITIRGVTYDFGCYGDKVYLVPRVKPAAVRRGEPKKASKPTAVRRGEPRVKR